MSAREQLRDARRIVVKLGTHVVTHDGVELALGRIHAIVEDLARLRAAGREVLLVSSGAIGMGMRELGLREPPASLGLRQACAAVGQGHLIGLYTGALAQLGARGAQVLLTQEDLAERDRALNLRTTLMRLLELDVIPILNENDSVSVREIIAQSGREGNDVAFGDNDGLSARVAVSIDADVLLMLTNVDGLHTANPHTNEEATRIRELVGIGDDVLGAADGESTGGTGGMVSKLEAARLATESGVTVVIASGAEAHAVRRCLDGEDLGTLILPPGRRSARRRSIAVAPRAGALVVNDGAIEALVRRKASLLPIGVLEVEGDFAKGDVVEIRDGSGRVHGRGLVNYDAGACRAVAGRHSADIYEVLGWQGYDALITRDNLTLGEV